MDQFDKDWLLSKGIPLSEVFDASGMALKQYKEAMRRADKYVAINVTPCKRAGHRIRTRHGKCIACDVTQYAFSKRHRTSGHVYLAASQSSGLLKVGMATNLENRLTNLSQRLYGGAKDWKLVVSLEVENAGKVEAEVHSELKEYQADGSYFDGDHQQSCFELFRCPLQTAVDAFQQRNGLAPLQAHLDVEAFAFSPDEPGRLQVDGEKVGRANRKQSSDEVLLAEARLASEAPILDADEAAKNIESEGSFSHADTSVRRNMEEEAPDLSQANATTIRSRLRIGLFIFMVALVALVVGYFFLSPA